LENNQLWFFNAIQFISLKLFFFSFSGFVRILIFNFYFSDSQKFEVCEERYGMNEIKEEIKDKTKEADEKPDIHLVKLGNIKYISTERGVELLKQIQDMFDRMDRYEKQRQEYQRTIVEKKRGEELRGEEKVTFSIPIDFIDHKEYITYETTQRGLEFFKYHMDPNKEEREFDRAEEIQYLTFYDGVILVREILKRIIEEYFEDDEKDSHGCSYGAGLWDKMNDILDNNILNQIRKHRAKDLHSLFEIKNCQYTI
jgi:hypothetical protein